MILPVGTEKDRFRAYRHGSARDREFLRRLVAGLRRKRDKERRWARVLEMDASTAKRMMLEGRL